MADSPSWFANKGQVVQAGIAAIAAIFSGINASKGAQVDPFGAGAILFYILIALVLVSAAQLLRTWRRRPNLKVIDAHVRAVSGLTYPLKYRVRMRNDSAGCIDVQVSRFEAKKVTVKRQVTSVLQVKLDEDLWPDKKGVDRIAVLPGQQFQAWIGIDETKFDPSKVELLRGDIGQLILLVNGQTIEIKL